MLFDHYYFIYLKIKSTKYLGKNKRLSHLDYSDFPLYKFPFDSTAPKYENKIHKRKIKPYERNSREGNKEEEQV